MVVKNPIVVFKGDENAPETLEENIQRFIQLVIHGDEQMFADMKYFLDKNNTKQKRMRK